MKIKNLPNFPEKYIPRHGGELEFADGYNKAREKIGDIGVELDVGKITSIMLLMSHRDKLGEAIADNLKDLIK